MQGPDVYITFCPHYSNWFPLGEGEKNKNSTKQETIDAKVREEALNVKLAQIWESYHQKAISLDQI